MDDHVITADESAVENFCMEEHVEVDDGGEIMVEVVGSDVLVHGGRDELGEDNLVRERESFDGKACVSSELNRKGNVNCRDEDFDSGVVEVNVPCPAQDQDSSVDIVNMEIDDGVTVGNASVLDHQVDDKIYSNPKAGDDLVDLCSKMESSSEKNQVVGGIDDTGIYKKEQIPEAEISVTDMDHMVSTEDGFLEQNPLIGGTDSAGFVAENLFPEGDWDERLNPLTTAEISNKAACSNELVNQIGESCKDNENFIGLNVGPEVQVEEKHNKGKQETEVEEQSAEFDQSTDTDEMTILLPESESEFSVSDLVWGKVRSHPWWPGQIFDPADASEKAKKYHKNDCFLVAYFGDRTFAWNDASVLKPFASNFSQIDKPSNSETFHDALSAALEEVSRRVQLGLTCSCVQKDSDYEMIESQIVDNAGIRAESSRRYGVDKSSGANTFEPDKLVENIRALAKSPFNGANQLELAVSKAQLLAFSRFKGYSGLPEFQICGGLLENNADSFQLSDEKKGILKSEKRSSNKRKHKLWDSSYPRKKERQISELMSDAVDSLDSEENEPVLSSSNRKRKIIDSVGEGSDKRISFYAAKVSTTNTKASTKPSFRVGECIRRVASQLTGSPSLVKCSGVKSPNDDVSDDPLAGFEDSFEIPDNNSQKDLSLDEMLVQLRSAARDPMKGYGVLKNIIPFFSSFRHSIASGQDSVKRKVGGSGRKKKAENPAVATPKEFEFEFDDVNESNDSYWTDRVVQNCDEEQALDNTQNGGESQPLDLEPDKPRKPRRSYKRKKQFSTGNLEIEAPEEPAEEIEARKPPAVLPPTGLILNFGQGGFVPSEMSLNKMFKRFGAIKESETEVDRESKRARVVFKNGTDAEVAFNSALKFNIFGSTAVSYELSYLQSLSFKSMPLETLQDIADTI